jgi:hypothetical protein
VDAAAVVLLLGVGRGGACWVRRRLTGCQLPGSGHSSRLHWSVDAAAVLLLGVR